ncbi:hypothetical protein JHK87_005977 [Glycine soja]|nr:hypothetical protein JHK87_005977 [Glycine soja]
MSSGFAKIKDCSCCWTWTKIFCGFSDWEIAPALTTFKKHVLICLQNCKGMLATCQNELKAAKSEIQKWHSSFQNEPFISAETTPR